MTARGWSEVLDEIRARWDEDYDGTVILQDYIKKELEENFVFLPKSDLPGTRVYPKGENTYIETIGVCHTRWNVETASADQARAWGLEYLAAARALDAYNAAERTNKLRLDGYASVYAGRAFDLCERSIQVMLERISELEAEVAK